MNRNNNNNLNERDFPWPVGHEPTKEEVEKYFKEKVGIPVSFHWEDIGGGEKRGVLTPIKKNMEILDEFEKGLSQPVDFEIKGSDGELRKVSKEEFANWMTEGKEEKNVKTPPKESLIYGASGDIDGTTFFIEKRGKDGVIKETYHEPRSEEDKKQIIERNKARREREKEEKEKSQFENSENKPTENLIQSDKNQASAKDKNNDFSLPTKIAIGGGIILIPVVLVGIVRKFKNK